MQFTSLTIEPTLDQWVEAIFHYKDFVPDHSVERVVPTGHAYLIFELDGITRHTFEHDSLSPNADFTKVWLSGVHDQYLSISAHEHSEMFVIQFKPYGAHPFIQQPMESLANRVTDGADLFSGGALRLREDLLKNDAVETKFAAATTWLEQHFSDQHTPPPRLIEIVESLVSDPLAKLKDVLGTFGGSQKHLIDLFKRYVGLTPKTFQQVLRFNQVLANLQSNSPTDWADLATQCGYADQSHFIREFRRFSGFKPEQFAQSGVDNDEGNFFPLDR